MGSLHHSDSLQGSDSWGRPCSEEGEHSEEYSMRQSQVGSLCAMAIRVAA